MSQKRGICIRREEYAGRTETGGFYNPAVLEGVQTVGDKSKEGPVFFSLGNTYYSRGEFEKALYNHGLYLESIKEGDKASKGRAYGSLGKDHHGLGNVIEAKKYHNKQWDIAKEIGDKAEEGRACANLGNVYYSMADIQWAIIMYRDALYTAKQTGDKVAMGRANRNLGNSYYLDGKFEDAIYYHRQDLEMAKELGDTEGEGIAYGNLGNVYFSQLEDFPEAIACYEKCLRVAVEAGNRAEEGKASYGLGCIYEFLRCLDQALKLFRRSLKAFDDIRSHGHLNDERKINVQDEYKLVIIGLWRVLLKQGKISEALSVAERGRVQALIDLMRATYGVDETGQSGSDGNRREITPDTSFQEDRLPNLLSYLPSKSTTLFLAIDKKEINIWVLTGGHVHFRRSEIGERCLVEGVPLSFDSLTRAAHPLTKNEIVSRANGCGRKAEQIEQNRVKSMNKALRILYDVVISKVEDLLTGEELVFVPDGPLCIAPFAAFLNSKSSRLSESFRIRVIPSLTSLKLIRDATEYRSENESVLLVGNPNLADVEPWDWDLPGAKEEVETIGKMFNIEPLVGKAATKEEVLSRLNSAALIHIAAHGKNGKILLTPNPIRASQPPKEEDYILTMADVAAAQLHAVVVLSNCLSGQGKITSEGAVGIARGFLAAGARCVLVSLWEIDDQITLKFMKFFYEQLMLGKKAGEALNHAMKYIKESNDYVQDWAAFQLIGDDVPLEFAKKQ